METTKQEVVTNETSNNITIWEGLLYILVSFLVVYVLASCVITITYHFSNRKHALEYIITNPNGIVGDLTITENHPRYDDDVIRQKSILYPKPYSRYSNDIITEDKIQCKIKGQFLLKVSGHLNKGTVLNVFLNGQQIYTATPPANFDDDQWNFDFTSKIFEKGQNH